jgi:uncharacterized protein DUF349
MSFLDRFKPQPRWKHIDPAVRAAAVPEIPDDPEHQDVIAELAAADSDVRVRRAAIGRVRDVALLASRARTEADAELRRDIADRLVAIATAPAATDGDAALALAGLDDPRQFATIAKSSPHETVRAAALGRVHEPRALSSIARHALDPRTALDAVARLGDGPELLNVALRTEHKEAGVAALDKTLSDGSLEEAAAREMLETVQTRAKSKAVSKRARAILSGMQEAEAARRLALEQWQHRVASVLARVEAIAANPSLPTAARELGDAEAEWRDFARSGTFELDTDTAGQFGALVESARTAIAASERALAEQRAAAEHAAALRAVRVSLCERLERVSGDGIIAELEAARAEWEGLPAPSADAGDQQLESRFLEATRAALERHANQQDRVRINERLAALSVEAERLSAEDQHPDEAWTALQREWESLQNRTDMVAPDAAERYAAADAGVRVRAEERRAAAERTLRQQIQRIEQLVERATVRAAGEDLTLREADRIARELRAAIDAPPAAGGREQQSLLERLKAAQGAIGPRLHELRELDEWKRFANAAVQEELIARTEALRAKYGFDTPEGVKPEDLEKVARELHEIQERWKQAAEAPRAQAQALWHRYRQAADPIQTKAREFFAQRVEERKRNLDRKLALIERAEALSQSTDWIKTAEELKKLQAEWQEVGPVPRQDTRATWKRFRDACDAFFTRRNADLALRKETWAANQARKEALCARAEELAASTEWERGAAEIRRLQAEWKNVGPVRRTKSEALWQRFRLACDTFFDRYKRRDEIELEVRQADREALVSELESLVVVDRGQSELTGPEIMGDIAPPPASPYDNAALLERVRSLRSRWNQSSPAVRQGADPLSARFMGALERLIAAYPEAFRGTELDTDANRRKMEQLCERVEGFMSELAVPATSSQALATMLREALASNTIGGRAGEETKWRAMADDVRSAQAAWTRLGPAPGETGRQLTDRFHRACSRFFEQLRRHVPQNAPQPQRGRPVGAR